MKFAGVVIQRVETSSLVHSRVHSLLPGSNLTPHLLYLTLQFFVKIREIFKFISTAVTLHPPYNQFQPITFHSILMYVLSVMCNYSPTGVLTYKNVVILVYMGDFGKKEVLKN